MAAARGSGAGLDFAAPARSARGLSRALRFRGVLADSHFSPLACATDCFGCWRPLLDRAAEGLQAQDENQNVKEEMAEAAGPGVGLAGDVLSIEAEQQRQDKDNPEPNSQGHKASRIAAGSGSSSPISASVSTPRAWATISATLWLVACPISSAPCTRRTIWRAFIRRTLATGMMWAP